MRGFWKNIGPQRWTLLGALTLGLAQLVVLADWLLIRGAFPWLSLWFFGSLLLVLLILIYRKLIINYVESKTLANNGFAQTESLFYLYSRLQLRKSLPRMRGFAISPDFANLIVDHVLLEKPEVIVECGAGISTLINGYLLEQLGQGQVFALEHDGEFSRRTAAELGRHGLSAQASVIHAPLQSFQIEGKTWKWYSEKGWSELPAIDFLIVDGPPAFLQAQARYPALPLLMEKLKPGAVVLVDDCVRQEDRQTVEQWIRQVPGWDLEWIRTEKMAALLRRRP